MKLRGVLPAVVGLALVAGLVLFTGPRAILEAMATAGWAGFAMILASQVLLTSVAGCAWAILGVRITGLRPAAFLGARFVREAAGQALPFTQIGGIALGARALALEGAPARLAIATTLADTALEFLSQLAYAAIGAMLLARLRVDRAVTGSMIGVVGALALMAALLVTALSVGAPWVERLIRRLSRRGDAESLPISETLADLRRRPAVASAAGLVHLAGWTLTAAQTWLILRLLHAPVGLGAALVIDSLTSATRAAAFVAPAGLGVQEGALLLLGHLFGIGAPAALALSLIRRGRDLALAVPVLGAWQARHGARLWSLGAARDRA